MDVVLSSSSVPIQTLLLLLGRLAVDLLGVAGVAESLLKKVASSSSNMLSTDLTMSFKTQRFVSVFNDLPIPAIDLFSLLILRYTIRDSVGVATDMQTIEKKLCLIPSSGSSLIL